jgi:hypothetical protein
VPVSVPELALKCKPNPPGRPAMKKIVKARHVIKKNKKL